MAYEMKDGQGSIFKNKFHEDGDSKPPYKGEVMWRGEKIEIALWVKEGAQAGKFFSVKLQEPREKPEATAARQAATPVPNRGRPISERAMPAAPGAGRRDDMDDDQIPF